MVNVTVNGNPVSVPEGTTILNAALAAGVEIPHLCYLKQLNEIGACRICCVEIEGERNLCPAATIRFLRAWSSAPTPTGCAAPAASMWS